MSLHISSDKPADTKMAYRKAVRLRRNVPYFDVENQFSPSNEILSYSVSLKKL
jgi:hypothetical protein